MNVRYALFALSILIGFVLAVYQGWAVRPLRAQDAPPAQLREDFQADYVLMVAEAFSSDGDAERAISQLGFLATPGERYNPYGMASDALEFGEANGYSARDLDLLQALQSGLLAFDPGFAP